MPRHLRTFSPARLAYFARCTQAAAAALLFTCAAPALAAPDWDIVGLRLGMTIDQARAALKAHNAQAPIKESMLKFTFHDGAKQQETAGFLANIQMQIPVPGTLDNEHLKLEFSGPPMPQRLIGVRRAVTTWKDPASDQRVFDALTGKYGQPATVQNYGIGVRNRVLDWAEAGKPNCGGQPGKQLMFAPATQSPAELRKYRQWQQQRRAPQDLSTCGARLRADMTIHQGGSSVVTLVVEMNDYSVMLPALEATAKWLDDLEAQARKARLNSGSAPKL